MVESATTEESVLLLFFVFDGFYFCYAFRFGPTLTQNSHHSCCTTDEENGKGTLTLSGLLLLLADYLRRYKATSD